MTAANIERIKSFFPKVEALLDLNLAPRAVQAERTVESPEPMGGAELRFDDIDMELAADTANVGKGVKEEARPELELFSESQDRRMAEEISAKFDNSLLQDFITETGEHLEDTERNLLRLEQQPEDAGVLNEIFRSIHTIKGSSEYLGLERIAELTHKLENLLDLLRRGERGMDAGIIDLLIGTNDRMSQLVDDLAQHQQEQTPIDDLVARIARYTGEAAPAAVEEAVAEEAAIAEAAVAEDEQALGDEYDEELFGIFTDQLKEGLQELWDETQKLITGAAADAVLACYEDRLSTLRASSNYMGYDKLKQLYGQWSQTVADTVGRNAAGESIDWQVFCHDVTAANIERIKRFFPKVEALQQLDLHPDETPLRLMLSHSNPLKRTPRMMRPRARTASDCWKISSLNRQNSWMRSNAIWPSCSSSRMRTVFSRICSDPFTQSRAPLNI